MDKNDVFQGSPWNVEPIEEWNRPVYWDNHYKHLRGEADSWRRDQAVYREVEPLILMLRAAGELPPRQNPPTFLDAGCGIALIPHVLAFWGFQVTAIDLCPQAVELASLHRPAEEELARCVPIWEPSKDFPGASILVEDADRSLQRLRSYQAPGGSVTYLAGDWCSVDLPPGAFDLVYCRNSLRCSTKSYWRRSLCRFHELLSPGGILLLETVNAIGIQEEVGQLLTQCGFTRLGRGACREASGRFVIDMWPTG
jgi:SAM-dependent methyltransferase